jgi:tetratricopeptide (TPR) repeat protein
LNAALRAYGQTRLNALRLPFRAIDVGPVQVRDLRPAEEALILSDIRLSAGVLESEAPQFAAFVRRQAVRFPDDPYALRLLAEAEDAAGNYAAAGRAAERLLAIEPGNPKGLMLRASAQLEALRSSGNGSDEAWEAARAHLLEANRRAPNDPQVLLAYYQSFTSQGGVPPVHAQNALVRAMNLVPQDAYMRYLVAADFEARDMIEDAITTIRPAASSAHKSDDDPVERARRQMLRQRYRFVGATQNESAREMLIRLERKLAERRGSAPAPAAAAQPGTPRQR